MLRSLWLVSLALVLGAFVGWAIIGLIMIALGHKYHGF